jgi:hypothetical protein
MFIPSHDGLPDGTATVCAQPSLWTLRNSSAGNEMEQYEQVTVINARMLVKEPLQNSTAGM